MIKLILYDNPPSLNKWQNLNCYAKGRIKKQWEHNIYYGIYNQRLSKPFKRARLRITIYFTTVRRRDKDNYLVAAKLIQDGLVKAHIIEDDRAEVIGLPEIEFGRAAKKRTEIEVWEVEE